MHNSKICFRCNTNKPVTEFYKHKGMADGRLNKCKECCKIESIRNRLNNIDYYLEYDKSRSNLPHRIKAREAYRKTDKGKKSFIKSRKKWLELNLIKRSAHIIVGNAVKSGKLIKSKICENCNKESSRINGHHDNYDEPLNVRWLCSKCHAEWHKEHDE